MPRQSQNRLKQMPKSALYDTSVDSTAYNPKLHTISLRRNNIGFVESLTFDKNTVLQSIDLYGNIIEEEVGGTYKHLEDAELQYLAQGNEHNSTVTKDEDGELPAVHVGIHRGGGAPEQMPERYCD